MRKEAGPLNVRLDFWTAEQTSRIYRLSNMILRERAEKPRRHELVFVVFEKRERQLDRARVTTDPF
jgi:hypothetical protein